MTNWFWSSAVASGKGAQAHQTGSILIGDADANDIGLRK
jgi:hypothetical protein